jgi:DNA polymerase-3 subunit alpha
MKIVSRRPMGYQKVYDIGLAQIHNFCLANGTIASNCFNKSHSVAYGYVTYQTAYLKANYTVEYMAALLSSVSGDRDKVQKYITNCLSLGIKVLPPDVNRSGMNFTPIGGDILFGLAAIKNLGLGAIEAILQARENHGQFTSLADLCDRVDSRALNKKSLEALIQAGAMDSILPNRRQLIQDLDPTLESANRKAKAQASGQGSLFDLFGTVPTTSTTDPVPDFSPADKLQLEKELLGFYVSDHPLKEVGNNAKLLTPTNLADVPELAEATLITAIVMITDIKEFKTKRGDPMAIIQIEDLSGTGEAVVFPKVYERVSSLLVKDQRLMLWGKLEQRDEQLQILVEDLQSIDEVQLLRLELSTEQALNRQELYQLKELLRSQSNNSKEDFSKIPVIISLNYGEQLVRLNNQNGIKNPQAMVELLTAKGFTAKLESLVP